MALAAWAAFAYVVLELEPEHVVSRLAFFAALCLALFASLTLAAYGLSFVLFADDRYRGNLRRCLWQGAVSAWVCTAAALLQAERHLTLPAVGALLVLFLIGQMAALLRE